MSNNAAILFFREIDMILGYGEKGRKLKGSDCKQGASYFMKTKFFGAKIRY